MAGIKVAGNVYVVESKYTRKEIELVEKHRPNLLKLYDEKGENAIFAVGYGEAGQVRPFCVQFNAETKTDKPVACVTMPLPKGEGDAKTLVVDAVGVAILRLNEVEENIAAALEAIKAEKAAIAEAVEVL